MNRQAIPARIARKYRPTVQQRQRRASALEPRPPHASQNDYRTLAARTRAALEALK